MTALASFLDARAHSGRWLVRMEDLDEDRAQPGAAGQILRDLEHFGLLWDGPVLRQTERLETYAAALSQLEGQGLLYPCACSRKEAAGRCTGICARETLRQSQARAWRVRVPQKSYCVSDAIQGHYCQHLGEAVGDFVLKRADGPFAYQLAVVVDDATQGVTHIVRGADLLDNTPRQMFLQEQLGLPTPRYAHVPVAMSAINVKLSKSTRAAALDAAQPSCELVRALQLLGHAPPESLRNASLVELLHWAIHSWDLKRVPRRETVEYL